MESTDSSMVGVGPAHLPPGFRFHPTDEELLIHYLRKKAASVPLPVPIIADIDLYKFDPWELPGMASFGEHEWYFFSQRDRKYPNGARPNRAATSGYWKATGTDKPVMTQGEGGRQKLGVKKALVFYGGKPPRGIKTNWIMHEYRLLAADHHTTNITNSNSHSNYNSHSFDPSNTKKASLASLRLDDWVLCRIYHKNNNNSPTPRVVLDNELERDGLLIHDHEYSSSAAATVPNSLLLQAAPPSRSAAAGLHQNHNYNLFEGLIGGGGGGQFTTRLPIFPSEVVPMKRTFPFLYWSTNIGTAKRFHEDESSNHINSTSIATMLNQQQVPVQSPSSSSSSHQQAMIGGDGVLCRHPFQLPWYT